MAGNGGIDIEAERGLLNKEVKQLPSPGGFFPLLLGVGDRSRPFQLVDVTQEEPPPTAVERLKTALAEAEIPPEAGHFLPLSAARDRQWERKYLERHGPWRRCVSVSPWVCAGSN